MIDAGDYYAVLYNPSRIDSNIGKVLQIKEIRLEQRTLYFKTTLTDPWKRFKVYDESKFEMPMVFGLLIMYLAQHMMKVLILRII